MLHDPRDGALYAALCLAHVRAKLYRSDDDGAIWVEIGLPAEGENPKALHRIWVLAAGPAGRPCEIWAGALPAALFRSPDRGAHGELV